jgi:hypothetical protein
MHLPFLSNFLYELLMIWEGKCYTLLVLLRLVCKSKQVFNKLINLKLKMSNDIGHYNFDI